MRCLRVVRNDRHLARLRSGALGCHPGRSVRRRTDTFEARAAYCPQSGSLQCPDMKTSTRRILSPRTAAAAFIACAALSACVARAARITLAACFVLTACALAAKVVYAQEATPGAQWLSVNNHLDGQRFSPLKEITPANANQLREVCHLQIDGPTTFHGELVVVDGMIYTNTGLETVAVDATTCALRWKFTYLSDEERASPSSRG